jgi:hypothetical protein
MGCDDRHRRTATTPPPRAARRSGSEAALGVGVVKPLRSLGPGPPGALPRAPLVSVVHHRGVRCSSGACPKWIPPNGWSADAGTPVWRDARPSGSDRPAPPDVPEPFLTARSSREAHLSAQGPSPLPQARLPSSHVGPRRAGHHQGPSPQGPSSSVGLRPGTRRSTGSPNVPSSASSAAPEHGADTGRSRWSVSIAPVRPAPRSRTRSHGEWATPWSATGCAGDSGSPQDPCGPRESCRRAPISSSLHLPRPRLR